MTTWNPDKTRAERRARAARRAARDLREREARYAERDDDPDFDSLADPWNRPPGWDPEDLWGQSKCDRCGEPFKPSDEVGEFFDPADEPTGDSSNHYIVHAQCGLDAEWELA